MRLAGVRRRAEIIPLPPTTPSDPAGDQWPFERAQLRLD
jgi:hypothetical protein